MNDVFFENKSLMFVVAAIAAVIAVIILLLAFRRAFRCRFRVTARGGMRPRLGVTDSFDLDRQRRLVIVRRDDVEHLIMIGGPTDLVVKARITHTEGRDLGEIREGAIPNDWLNEATHMSAGTFRPRAVVPRRNARTILLALAQTRVKLAEMLSIRSGLIPLALLSGAAGAASGFIGGLFRLALRQADQFRATLPVRWHEQPLLGFILMIAGAAIATALAVWLVRRFMEHAAGSGIPHIEAVIGGELPPPSLILLPVKFVGGLLGIGAGLALGREGPSVQMGATLAHVLGTMFGRNWADCRSLLAAGAGAGLAAAFNAPFAGSAFVLEELIRQFDVRDAVAALGATGSAIVVAQLLTGPAPIFDVGALPHPELSDNLLCFALGIIAGMLGVVYNRVILGALEITDRLARCPAELRAALIGAAVGALAWFTPSLAGAGEVLIQQTLDATYALSLIPFLYVLRLALGAASYASGAPGGIFAPLLVLGAQMGFFFGTLSHPGLADPASYGVMFAVVGMAAFFSAVVRAPLTGMILVTEMTETSTLLLPMLAACFSAMAVATVLGEPPIYDSLKERTLLSQ